MSKVTLCLDAETADLSVDDEGGMITLSNKLVVRSIGGFSKHVRGYQAGAVDDMIEFNRNDKFLFRYEDVRSKLTTSAGKSRLKELYVMAQKHQPVDKEIFDEQEDDIDSEIEIVVEKLKKLALRSMDVYTKRKLTTDLARLIVLLNE